ncbi:hypothetical protein B0H13DRAFT_2377063 [Mycena leptocephala]|nr:hypothetical protein B0H13DRAFT_2377063 [Mycena leptocephala]
MQPQLLHPTTNERQWDDYEDEFGKFVPDKEIPEYLARMTRREEHIHDLRDATADFTVFSNRAPFQAYFDATDKYLAEFGVEFKINDFWTTSSTNGASMRERFALFLDEKNLDIGLTIDKPKFKFSIPNNAVEVKTEPVLLALPPPTVELTNKQMTELRITTRKNDAGKEVIEILDSDNEMPAVEEGKEKEPDEEPETEPDTKDGDEKAPDS